jgi:receptor expression-enhancing protein 5/6
MDLTAYLDKIRRAIEKSPFERYATDLHEKTGVSPEIYVIALGFLVAFMLFFGIFADLICDVIGYGYPLYASLKVIEYQERDQDKQWLVYWVVFGLLGCVETFVHVIVYWIPFYYPLKLAFLVWCMSPQYAGASVIYNTFLKEFVSKHIHHIDATLSEVNVTQVLKATINTLSPK